MTHEPVLAHKYFSLTFPLASPQACCAGAGALDGCAGVGSLGSLVRHRAVSAGGPQLQLSSHILILSLSSLSLDRRGNLRESITHLVFTEWFGLKEPLKII